MACFLGVNSQIILNITQYVHSLQTEGLISHSFKSLRTTALCFLAKNKHCWPWHWHSLWQSRRLYCCQNESSLWKKKILVSATIWIFHFIQFTPNFIKIKGYHHAFIVKKKRFYSSKKGQSLVNCLFTLLITHKRIV